MKYVSPYEITNDMLVLVSSIMKKIGKLDNYKDLDKMPVLRKNNRIRSIHSSLAIEANSLSFNEVKDVIEGKTVIGSEKEIQEVKNAYEAYSKIKEMNPYSINDLKKIHGIMTYLTVSESGKLRSGNEGVFGENGNCIHICPPPDKVNGLMTALFDWLKENKDSIHPLILSSIFHYEFVFIHPFSDGNGRTGRLVMSFQCIQNDWIPPLIENENRSKYLECLNVCQNDKGAKQFVSFLEYCQERSLELIGQTQESKQQNIQM